MSPSKHLCLCFGLLLLIQGGIASLDYGLALRKSVLYYESQRSGKLPLTQRVSWRGDSALKDGSDKGVDLVGGYYDAGDNVKFGFPMAYTITMLAWSVVEYDSQLAATGELVKALEAIRWGTDYILKAHPEPDVLYAEVGDGDSDHACWQRPEDMTTPRTIYKIDAANPGSDLAAECAAALAASSIVFSYYYSDEKYPSLLLTHAKQLFDFANNYPGLYSNSIPVAKKFYTSSGDQDEKLWAASWLHLATGDEKYIQYIDAVEDSTSVRSMFSWDDKYVGFQVLIAKMILNGNHTDEGKWHDYKTKAEGFICNCLQKGDANIKRSPGGLNWWSPWNNLQYVTSAAFVATVYSDYLAKASVSIECSGDTVSAEDILAFAKLQVDYILGTNPKDMSYMVGFGTNYPKQVHHRGASIISFLTDSTPVTCQGGFDNWFNKNASDPNVLEGAVVGGPSDNDEYRDERSNFNQAEPATANTAPLVGVLARLATQV